jgi:NitT/TauT family transport system ATP-binding protein
MEAPQPLVVFDGVTKFFPTRTGEPLEALAPVDLTINEGEFVSVVGPSGCGKSTLLSIVAGLETATTGAVRVGGADIHGPYTGLGMAFQKDLLLEWRTAIDNVLLQAEVRGLRVADYRKRARELLGLVGLSGFEDHYPAELSGGMRQRVSVCRALLHDPPILLMDEPFAALDALTRDQLALDFQALALQQRKTTMFITHSVPEAVMLADTVVVFSSRPGRILESIKIDLPRPRRLADRESPEFSAYAARIRKLFESQGILREATA